MKGLSKPLPSAEFEDNDGKVRSEFSGKALIKTVIAIECHSSEIKNLDIFYSPTLIAILHPSLPCSFPWSGWSVWIVLIGSFAHWLWLGSANVDPCSRLEERKSVRQSIKSSGSFHSGLPAFVDQSQFISGNVYKLPMWMYHLFPSRPWLIHCGNT